MKKFISLFFGIIVLLLSNNTFAAESDCGLNSNGTIDQTNIAICEDDIVFNVYETIFPVIVNDTIFKFLDFDYIEKDSESITDNYSFLTLNKHKIIVGISGIINTSLIIVVFIIVARIIYLGIAGTAKDGSFLGEEYDGKKAAYGFGGFMLLLSPVGTGITLLQLITMLLSILSISLSNGIFAFYLNFISGDYFFNKQSQLSDYEVSQMDNNSYIYSYKYVASLISGSLCNRVSEQFAFESSFGVLSSNNIKDNINCVYGQNGYGVNIETAPSGDVVDGIVNKTYTVTKLGIDGVDFVNTSLGFGRQGPLSGECSTFRNFNCLSVNISLPAISDPEIARLVGESDLLNIYKGTISGLSIGGDNYGAIYSGWESIKANVFSKYANEDGGLSINDSRALKALSLFYHQLIQNYFMIGYLEISNIGGVYSPKSMNFNSINSVLMKVDSIIDSIERGNCSLSGYGVDDIYKTKDALNGILNSSSTELDDSYSLESMRCVKFTGDSFVAQLDKKYDFSVEGDSVAAFESGNAYNAKAIDELNNLVKDLSNTRIDVNKSFQKSLSDINNSEFFIKLRQKGMLSLGFYSMEIAKKNDLDGKFRKYIDKNGFSLNPNFESRTMISNDIYNDKVRNYTVNNYGSFQEMSKINNFVESLNPLLSGTSDGYISNVVNEIGDGKVSAGYADSSMTKALNSVANKFTNIQDELLNATGAKLIFGTKEDMIRGYEDCITTDSECHKVVTQNPIIRLNEFGHDLINTSVAVGATLVTVSWLTDRGAYLASEAHGASASLDGFIGEKGKFGSKLTILSKIFEKGLSLFGVLIELLLFFVILMAAFGFVLAYMIPLMPMIKFLVEVVSWLMVSVLSFFIANMWAVFMISPPKKNEGKNLIVNTIWNYIVQLVFRLPLITISYIIVWSLLTVFMMLVNFLFSMVANSLVSHSDSIMFLFTMSLVLVSYIFIIFIVFKFTVGLLTYIPQKVTSKMGVDSNPSEGGMAALILAKANTPTNKIKGSAKNIKSFGKLKR